MALNAAESYLVLLVQYMSTNKTRLRLATDAQPEASRVPATWKTGGDGRARGGREAIWPINDITLTVKVCFRYLKAHSNGSGRLMGRDGHQCIIETRRVLHGQQNEVVK